MARAQGRLALLGKRRHRPIKDDEGKLIGFAKITRDMTDKRDAQQALLEAERRFRILVQGVTDYAIYMLDPEGRVTNWNAGAERIKGYSPDEIIGEHFSRFYTPEDFEAGVPTQALETARETGRYEAEGWRVRKDGTRFWASVVIDAIKDEDGELIGFAKITRDMTDKRETQLRLEESREQLFRSQKMEALGQLTGGLAHDFNNLLTAILGAADLASRNIDDPEKLKRMLEGIRNSAQRGAGLTKQLLAFARAQPLEIRQIDLKSFLGDVTTLMRPSLRSNIELRHGNLRPAVAGRFRRRGARARDPQPRLQRPRRDEGRRNARISAQNVVLNGQARRSQGRTCCAEGHRHWHRHVAGDHGARVRAVLHDQELRRGDRPGPQPGVRLRQADRRRRQRRIRRSAKAQLSLCTCPPAAALRPRKASRTACTRSARCSSSRTIRWSPS